MNIFREIGDRSLEATILCNIAETYQQMGNLVQSKKNCDEALIIATELSIPLVEDLQELKAILTSVRDKNILLDNI